MFIFYLRFTSTIPEALYNERTRGHVSVYYCGWVDDADNDDVVRLWVAGRVIVLRLMMMMIAHVSHKNWIELPIILVGGPNRRQRRR